MRSGSSLFGPLPVGRRRSVERVRRSAGTVQRDEGDGGGFIGLHRKSEVKAVVLQVLAQPWPQPTARKAAGERTGDIQAGEAHGYIGWPSARQCDQVLAELGDAQPRGTGVVSPWRSFVSVNDGSCWAARRRRRDVDEALAKDQDLVRSPSSIIVIAGGGRVATLGTGHRLTVPCSPTAAQAALS